MNALTGTTTLFLPFGKELYITAGTFMYRETDFSGVTYESAVVLPADADTLLERRRMLADSFGDDDALLNDLVARCSVTDGVCFHTYDEIKALNSPWYDGRSLQETDSGESTTYAEVSADIAILNKDSRSGLSRASSFLSALFGLNMTANAIGTTTISFTMKERCVNYVELATACMEVSAPEVIAATQDYGDVVDAAAPYPGLVPFEGKWFFFDDIEYSSDPYTYSLKVRYSHDPLRENRQHVVLMDKSDPSHVVTYDEVTTLIDPNDQELRLAEMTTFITNWKEENSLDDVDGAGNLLGEDRRRLEVDDLFHRHLKKKLQGFPKIRLPDFTRPSPTASGNLRRLQNADGSTVTEEEDEEIIIEEELTGQNVNGLYDISNITASVDAGVLTEDEASLLQTNFSGTVTSLPVDLVSNVTEPDGVRRLDASWFVAEPVAVFSAPALDVVPTLIRWPKQSESVVLETFNSVEIVQRNTLQMVLDESTNLNITSRRLVSSQFDFVFNQRHLEIEAKYEKDWAKFEASLLGLQGHIRNASHTISHGRKLASSSKLLLPPQEKWEAKCLNKVEDNQDEEDREEFVDNTVDNEVSIQLLDKLTEYALPELIALLEQGGETMVSIAEDNLSDECGKFHGRLTILQEFLQKYVFGPQEQIHEKGTVLLQSLKDDDLENLETKMESFIALDTALKPLMPIFARIPYIGPLIKYFRMGYAETIKRLVKPLEGKLNSLNRKIKEKEIEQKLEKFLERNCEMGEKFAKLNQAFVVTSYLVVLLDSSCVGGQGGGFRAQTVPMCTAMNEPIDALLDKIGDEAQEAMDTVHSVTGTFKALADDVFSFLEGSALKAAEPLVSFLGDAFGTVNTFLRKEIAVYVPWAGTKSKSICKKIRYPAGRKMCRKRRRIFGRRRTFRYPCGIKWKYKKICTTIKYPYFYAKKFGFSVMQVLNGIVGMMSIVTNALDAAVSSAAKAMGLSFPSIPLPGLPSTSVVSDLVPQMEDFVDFSLPSIEDEVDALLASLPAWAQMETIVRGLNDACQA